MEDMTARVSSPWLEMQAALASLRRITYVLSGFIGFSLVILALIGLQGVLDLSLLFVISLGLLLAVTIVELRRFCAAVTERIRQLSEQV